MLGKGTSNDRMITTDEVLHQKHSPVTHLQHLSQENEKMYYVDYCRKKEKPCQQQTAGVTAEYEMRLN